MQLIASYLLCSYVASYVIFYCAGWISPSTLLIGYYHSLLIRNINADLLVDKMSSNGLLAAHDQELILTGHSVHQRNWLLLEYVRHMEMQTLMKFYGFVQEMSPQVGLQLIAGMQLPVTYL